MTAPREKPMTDAERLDLESWIAEHVMGYKWIAFDLGTHRGASNSFCTLEVPTDRLLRQGGKIVPEPIKGFERDIGGVPKYTTDPAAAMELLEAIIKRCGSVLITNTPAPYQINSIGRYARGETLPEAISKFAKEMLK